MELSSPESKYERSNAVGDMGAKVTNAWQTSSRSLDYVASLDGLPLLLCRSREETGR